MRRLSLFVLGPLLTAAPLWAQENVRDEAARPLPAAEDPVNQYVAAVTVDGLVLSIGIDGSRIMLERAQPARIPAPRERQGPPEETVTVTGLRGETRVASVTVADPINIAVEEQGAVRSDRRTLYAALPTPSAIDAVEVRVAATGAAERFDVRPAYREICAALPHAEVCAGK